MTSYACGLEGEHDGAALYCTRPAGHAGLSHFDGEANLHFLIEAELPPLAPGHEIRLAKPGQPMRTEDSVQLSLAIEVRP